MRKKVFEKYKGIKGLLRLEYENLPFTKLSKEAREFMGLPNRWRFSPILRTFVPADDVKKKRKK